MDTTPIRVFLSYSWDSDPHKERVLQLAQRLRKDGVDARIDRFTSFPPEGWPRWMENEIEKAAFVLAVVTEKYAERFSGSAPPGTGLGANWEGAIITQELYEAGGRNEKFIPVVFDPSDRAHVPIPLRPFSAFCVDGDRGYLDLYRLITGQPEIVPADIGQRLNLPPRAGAAHLAALPMPPIHSVGAISPLHQLPPPPPAFTGREADLDDLEKQIAAGQAGGAAISGVHAGLQGMGGVGKTALAVVLAHRLIERYPDAQILLDLHGADAD